MTQPIRNSIEMGFSGTNGDPDFSELIAKLSVLPEYQLLFSVAFGSPVIDETGIQKALSQFIRSIQPLDSKYDAGSANAPFSQPFPNFTESENRGKQLFGAAGCGFCHGPNSFFNAMGNNGVIIAIGGGTDLTVTKSPALRDLFNPNGQLNGPLMHNGAFTSIAQVIDHYSAIPRGIPNIAPMFSTGSRPGYRTSHSCWPAEPRVRSADWHRVPMCTISHIGLTNRFQLSSLDSTSASSHISATPGSTPSTR